MLHQNDAPRQTENVSANSNNNNGEPEAPIWKVLVFDSFCRDIVSTVLRVNDLRENGVTVHMQLEAQRSSIPDVPAVYFVQSKPENINRIAEDIANDLYELYYINFASSLPRTLLEDFAVQTTASGKSHQIAQVYDQYLNFLTPEENMFSLHMPGIFESIHNPSMTDVAMNSLIDRIVSALFSVVLTLKTIPTICAPRGNAAEMVATRLDAKLREHILGSRHNLFSEGAEDILAQSRRPVLVLLDRDFDLGSMFMHSWTYQALIHDIFDIKLNQVNVEQADDTGRKVKKSYDLNVNDSFWASNALLPFPEVAVNIDDTSMAFKREADEITRMGGVNSLDEMGNIDMNASTKQLQRAITSLPELTARKANIDMHMNIATAMLDSIKNRQLDDLFQIEEQLGRQTKASILETINDSEKKNPQDKLRLFILYVLANESSLRQSDIDECTAALKAAGCDLAPFEYLNKLRSLNKMNASIASPGLNGIGFGTGSTGAGGSGGSSGAMGSSDLLGKFSSISNRLAGFTEGSSLGSIFSNVRNLLPTRKQLPITRVVESVMAGKSSTSSGLGIGGIRTGIGAGGSSGGGSGGGSNAIARMIENFVYFDPKQARRGNLTGSNAGGPSHGSSAIDGAAQEAIVFVVGGGNYIEYQNLLEFSQRSTPRKHIVYGSTSIINAESFLSELSQLNSMT
ncbi:Vesicle trafficking between the ER and Golgi [Coemansia spiralis]|uniref:Vesicle trafficking between the ER and Golgi n=2 Tax=Coemansia TaxID=4863 RepID=A0A9W8G7Y6_9FUNG|nr:Vesicle trafficking between the ER and Golgi [Coemansia umbellata]KAJ2675997.1 Vesicle trafficking between the ER and Golgi [Coemansia spiralis]